MACPMRHRKVPVHRVIQWTRWGGLLQRMQNPQAMQIKQTLFPKTDAKSKGYKTASFSLGKESNANLLKRVYSASQDGYRPPAAPNPYFLSLLIFGSSRTSEDIPIGANGWKFAISSRTNNKHRHGGHPILQTRDRDSNKYTRGNARSIKQVQQGMYFWGSYRGHGGVNKPSIKAFRKISFSSTTKYRMHPRIRGAQ